MEPQQPQRDLWAASSQPKPVLKKKWSSNTRESYTGEELARCHVLIALRVHQPFHSVLAGLQARSVFSSGKLSVIVMWKGGRRALNYYCKNPEASSVSSKGESVMPTPVSQAKGHGILQPLICAMKQQSFADLMGEMEGVYPWIFSK